MEERGWAAYVAEFIGTFVLVLFIGMVLSIFAANGEGLGYVDFTVIGLVHVFVLAMLIASLGGVCGAHFNPAVTITMLALRKIRGGDAAVYVILQLAGGILAAVVVKQVLSDEGEAVKYGATVVSKEFLEGKDFAGFIVEAIGTFALVWAIMGFAVIPRAQAGLAPFVIGGTLGAAVMTLGPLTGAGFNPARSWGPMLVAGDFFDEIGTELFVYGLGPVVGALLAGLIYNAIARGPKSDEAGDPAMIG